MNGIEEVQTIYTSWVEERCRDDSKKEFEETHEHCLAPSPQGRLSEFIRHSMLRSLIQVEVEVKEPWCEPIH